MAVLDNTLLKKHLKILMYKTYIAFFRHFLPRLVIARAFRKGHLKWA